MWTSHAEEKVGERRTTHAGTVEPWEPGRQEGRQAGRQAGGQVYSRLVGGTVTPGCGSQAAESAPGAKHLLPVAARAAIIGPRAWALLFVHLYRGAVGAQHAGMHDDKAC
jgi:hypothetical protein